MSYVDNNLMPGEKVLYRAHVHWIIYGPGYFYVAIGLALLLYIPHIPAGPMRGIALPVAGVIALLGFSMLSKALVYKQNTEFAVTNMRVIAKTGWISRNLLELRYEKIEGISMQQTVTGRIFNFGTLVLSGTGGDKTYIQNIFDPSAFSNHAMAAIGQRG